MVMFDCWKTRLAIDRQTDHSQKVVLVMHKLLWKHFTEKWLGRAAFSPCCLIWCWSSQKGIALFALKILRVLVLPFSGEQVYYSQRWNKHLLCHFCEPQDSYESNMVRISYLLPLLLSYSEWLNFWHGHCQLICYMHTFVFNSAFKQHIV